MLDGYALASAEEKTDNILFGTVSPDAWAEANRRVREMASVSDLSDLPAPVAD